MGKNQNSFARRQRETERKRKAAEKIARRRQIAADAKAGIVREEEESPPVDGAEEAVEP
jgi:hypothetical protein